MIVQAPIVSGRPYIDSRNITSLIRADVSLLYDPGLNTENVRYIDRLFAGQAITSKLIGKLNELDLSKVETMDEVFQDARPQSTGDGSDLSTLNIDMTNVTSMSGFMSMTYYSFSNIPRLINCVAGRAVNASAMFSECSVANIELPEDFTPGYTRYMFRNSMASKIAINVSNISDATGMFSGCYELTDLTFCGELSGCVMDLSSCEKLSSASVFSVLGSLSNLRSGATQGVVIFNNIAASCLSMTDYDIAAEKGWSIQVV